MSQLKKELALVKSMIPPDHPLDRANTSISNTVNVDKGGTYEGDSGSTEIDKEEEVREFSYYITRQARSSAKGNKNKGGIRVRGR